MSKIKRPFSPKQSVRVRTETAVTSLDGTLVLKPKDVIVVAALRFLKAARLWIVCLKNGLEFYAHYFTEYTMPKRRIKRRERLILRPAYIR